MRGDANAIPAPVKFASKLDAAADADASVSIDAAPGVSHVLVGVEYSYLGAVGTGQLIIYDGIVAVKTIDVKGEDHWPIDFSQLGPVGGIPATMGNNLQVKLTAGGVGVTGKLNFTYR